MNDEAWGLIVVIGVAFVVGYSVVSFVAKKLKSRTSEPDVSQGGEPPDKGAPPEPPHELDRRNDSTKGRRKPQTPFFR